MNSYDNEITVNISIIIVVIVNDIVIVPNVFTVTVITMQLSHYCIETSSPLPFLILLDRQGENALEEEEENRTRQVPIQGISFERRRLPNCDEAVQREHQSRDDRLHCRDYFRHFSKCRRLSEPDNPNFRHRITGFENPK